MLLEAKEKIWTTWEQHVKPNLEAGIYNVKDATSVANEKIRTMWGWSDVNEFREGFVKG